MKDTSKVIMGATLVMVVSLAIVLGLVLVLLAELYCSLLLRKRRFQITTSASTNTTIAQTQQQNQSVLPLTRVYAQGVFQAPRRFLFPFPTGKEEENLDTEKDFSEPQLLQKTRTQESIEPPHGIGIISASSPSPSFMSLTPPKPIQEVASQGASSSGGQRGSGADHLVYISNPIYDNDIPRYNGVANGVGTPFETPDTSPSRLETEGCSSEEDDDDVAEPSPTSPTSPPITPPLTPMKKLPVEACSVSLRDARSLGTSGSDSNSNNGISSSSSSGSPRTSPSW